MEHQRVSENPEYKEKIWGKTVEGEYVIDGYAFRGKKLFKRALEGIKVFMRKGAMKEVNKIKITVLDVRKNGGGDDIEIELLENVSRGKGIIKLIGPNSNNEYVIMVNKSKQSEHKYVKILTGKVVKPLIKDFIAENIDLEETEDEKVEKEGPNPEKKPDVLKCPYCDKTSYSSPGLKCHITKMHKDVKQVTESKQKEVIDDNIEKLLDDSTKSLHDDGDDSKITIEDSSDKIVEDTSSVKKYSQVCKDCDFKSEAAKNYTAVRIMLKHSQTCCSKKMKKNMKNNNCFECDYAALNGQEMKRHMRDQHNLASVSTSPPPKKTKIQSKEMSGNVNHDNDDTITDLNSSMEDMEIDEPTKLEETLKERSNCWDNKVILKQKDKVILEENKKKGVERKEWKERRN